MLQHQLRWRRWGRAIAAALESQRMGAERDRDYSEVLKAMRETREAIESRKSRLDTLEDGLNDVYKRINRPGAMGDYGVAEIGERKQAVDLLRLRYELKTRKFDPQYEFTAREDQIEEAKAHIQAVGQLMRTADVSRLPDFQRKALSSFSFGSNEFLLPPNRERQNR
jgi:DNA repair exonuclease SbcCD ATPase subunit